MGRANAGLLDSWPGRTGEAEGADRRHRRLGAAPLSPLPLSDVWHFLRPRGTLASLVRKLATVP